jgi:hypothetical protein
MSYEELEKEREKIINQYCCRLHIIDPDDVKRVTEIEEAQRLLRIKEVESKSLKLQT